MIKIVCWIATFLSSLGAINWGLVAFLNFNSVEYLSNLSGIEGLDKVLYGLVAIAGIYTLISLFVLKQ